MTTGLRERKRIAAMHRIQSVALDLFDAQGFDGVTVEQIAQLAEASPSSVYRYFGTKEQLVLWDEWDPQMERLVRAEAGDGGPLTAVRRAMQGVLAGLGEVDEARIRRRVRLMMTTPAIEAAAAGYTYALSESLGEVIGELLGRSAMDLEVQVLAHAGVGSALGALHHWYGTGFAEPLAEVLDQCFEILAAGPGARPAGHEAP